MTDIAFTSYATCTYGNSAPHPLGKQYWQIVEDGVTIDVCIAHHLQWAARPPERLIGKARSLSEGGAQSCPPDPPASIQSDQEALEAMPAGFREVYKALGWTRGTWREVIAEIERLRALSPESLCKRGRSVCNNEARYDSGYCGVHDILFNDGKGQLRRC